MSTILHIDSSARRAESVTRQLSQKVVDQLSKQAPGSTTIYRDLAAGNIPLLTEEMVGSYFTNPDERSAEQIAAIKVSDELVAELQQADTIVIGAPMYNFGVPGALKAWFDLVARVGVTFRYGEAGPIGLLENNRAIIVIATGGVPVNSEVDFATPHLQQFLRFLGVGEIEVVSADTLMAAGETKLQEAGEAIEALSV